MLITISRQFGAGGAEVARRVAAELGWRVVDNELLDRIAERAGLPPEEVADREETAPGFIERLARALARSAPETFPPTAEEPPPEPAESHLVRVTETVVAEMAAESRVVLVGRAGAAVLGRSQDVLHVKVVAPLRYRIEEVARRGDTDLKGAEHLIRESDGNRVRYHKQYYQRDWNDASNYHMVLNTEALGLDGVTGLIVGRAKALWPNATKERRKR
ncbi:MAG: AAA family ATPase [Gemmatimonadales bacterium]